MEIAALQRHGGIATREQLLADGVSPFQLTAAVRRGDVVRLRRAWYAIPEAPFDRRIAVALGGRLGSVSALRSYGVWTVPDDAVHVSWGPHGNVARPGRRLAYPALHRAGPVRVVPHWRLLRDRERPEGSWRESPEEALAQALRSEPPHLGLAAVDSALHRGLVERAQLPWIADGLPADCRRVVDLADGSVDSGLESILRFLLHSDDMAFRTHPVLHGLEVDALVGRSLVVETDGGEFHSGPRAFETDRRRDALLAMHGFLIVRFSYRQLVDDPWACRERIRAHTRRGDHLRPVD